MATYIERASAIINALVDGTASTDQKLRVVDAYVADNEHRIIELGFDPETLTAEQKSRAFIVYLKKVIREIMERVDPSITDVQASYIAAVAAVKAELDAEFVVEEVE